MRRWRWVVLLLASLAGSLLAGVPAAQAQEAAQEPAAQEEAAQEAPTYTVKTDDTLYSIARAHGLTVEELQALNGLEDTVIKIGQELIVGRPEAANEPAAGEPVLAGEDSTAEGGSAESAEEEEASAVVPIDSMPAEEAPAEQARAERADEQAASGEGAARYGRHTVGAGETLYSIAARFGVAADTLRALNAPLPSYLRAGHVLRLPPSWGPPTHRVREDETLYDLAAQYGVSVRTWRRVNDLPDSAEVSSGQRLRVPGRAAPEAPPAEALPPAEMRGPLAAYPASFAGRLTASGVPYDAEAYVVSHPDLPFGTVVLLVNLEAGRRTFARVVDRGPLDERYVMDASAAVLEQLGLAPESGQPVEVRIVDRGGV